MPENYYNNNKRPSLVGPVLLISIGVVFLLNNLGVIQWDIWSSLLRLWPLFLVAAGVDLLLGRRSMLGQLISIAIILAIFAGAIWFMSTVGYDKNQSIRTETYSYAIEGDLSEANVEVDFSVGELNIIGAALDGDYSTGTLNVLTQENIQHSYAEKDGEVHFFVGSNEVQTISPTWPNMHQRPVWDIQLNWDVPLSLDVNAGVGDITVDLQNFIITNLEMDAGVGKVTVYLPSDGSYDAYFDGGVGTMNIYLPENAPVVIQVDGGLGNVSMPNSFTREGDTYYSSTCDHGIDCAQMYLNGGVGSINVYADKGR